jgi:hypothetical protein
MIFHTIFWLQMFMNTAEYSHHPDLRLSPVTFFCPRPDILKEARKFTLTMLTFLRVSETPLKLQHLTEIWKRNNLEEGDKAEPAPKKRTVTFSKLAAGLD